MAFAGTGGSVRIAAGAGTATSSGSVLIETPNAGRAGVSGSITLRSGTTSQGDSGYLSLVTGDAVAGSAGFFFDL